MILCILFFYVFKVYLSNIDSETAEIFKQGDWILGMGVALYYDLKYNR